MAVQQSAATEPTFTVHYQDDIWNGRPMADPGTCRHPGTMAFPIGMRIERTRGRNGICVQANICMDCGSDSTGQVDLVEGLTMAYHEANERMATPFLWRTYDLVEHRRGDLAGKFLPIWMATPLGMTPGDIDEALLCARVGRAADYMASRVARYAEGR